MTNVKKNKGQTGLENLELLCRALKPEFYALVCFELNALLIDFLVGKSDRRGGSFFELLVARYVRYPAKRFR